jgi:hypothetical protein
MSHHARPKLQVIEGGLLPEHEWTEAEVRRVYEPAIKALPFVGLKKDAEPRWRPESYWRVTQSTSKDQDEVRGQHYAIAAVAAMRADGCNVLPDIFRDMIDASVKRELDAIKNKRRYPKRDTVMRGFLDQLAKMFDPRVGGEFADEFDGAIRHSQEMVNSLTHLAANIKGKNQFYLRQLIDLQKLTVKELEKARERIRVATKLRAQS